MTERPDPRAVEDLAPELAVGSVLWLVGGLVAGGVLGLLALPHWLPGLAESLRGDAPHAPWFVSRASGLVAFVLLWLTTCTGLVVSARIARDLAVTPAVLDLHQHLALTTLAFVALHALVLLADEYIGFSFVEIALPFLTRRFKPFFMGLGQVAFYGLVPVTLAFYLRRDLGRVAWRGLHAGSFVAFGLALAHAVYAGSSAGSLLHGALYWLAAATVLLLSFYRLLVGPPAAPEA